MLQVETTAAKLCSRRGTLQTELADELAGGTTSATDPDKWDLSIQTVKTTVNKHLASKLSEVTEVIK